MDFSVLKDRLVADGYSDVPVEEAMAALVAFVSSLE
jgi:hypothetical protein